MVGAVVRARATQARLTTTSNRPAWSLNGSMCYAVSLGMQSSLFWRRGYHSLMSSFGKVFHVEKRWKLIREMGSGAYGFVM